MPFSEFEIKRLEKIVGQYIEKRTGRLWISVTKLICLSRLRGKVLSFLEFDRLFKNNDQLKTNTALQMKDAGIEFKAI